MKAVFCLRESQTRYFYFVTFGLYKQKVRSCFDKYLSPRERGEKSQMSTDSLDKVIFTCVCVCVCADECCTIW